MIALVRTSGQFFAPIFSKFGQISDSIRMPSFGFHLLKNLFTAKYSSIGTNWWMAFWGKRDAIILAEVRVPVVMIKWYLGKIGLICSISVSAINDSPTLAACIQIYDWSLACFDEKPNLSWIRERSSLPFTILINIHINKSGKNKKVKMRYNVIIMPHFAIIGLSETLILASIMRHYH